MRSIIWVFVLALNASLWGGERPNILFCIADDASYPFMGAYGCKWVRSPGFDRVAREGLLFNRAYTPNAKCAPSRSSLLTGRNSWQLEAAANHSPIFPPEYKLYTEVLAEKGYFVGKTGKGWGPGLALKADGTPRAMTGLGFDQHKAKSAISGISDNDYAKNFSAFLDARPKDQPFCFWFGSLEPHRGYQHGAAVASGRKLNEIDRVPRFWPDNETVRTDMLDYAMELEHFDAHLLRMIETLEKRGELENTLIVVTADNGMPFPRVKGQEYELSNHMPFACMWKKGIRNPGRVIDDYVSFIDLAPTYLELAGIPWNESGMRSSPGRSLTDIFYSEKSGRVTAERDCVVIGKERHDVGRPNDEGYPIRGIVKDGWLYLQNHEIGRWPSGNPETGYLNCDGGATKTEVLNLRPEKYWQLCFGMRPKEELYDVQKDMDCVNNVATDTQFSERKEQLKARLEKILREQEDPRILGNGAIFDRYPYSEKANRDFYNRMKAGEKMKAGWVSPTDFDSR